MPEKEYTTEEAAEILQVSARTIRNMIVRRSLIAWMERKDPTRKGVYKIPQREIDRIQKIKTAFTVKK